MRRGIKLYKLYKKKCKRNILNTYKETYALVFYFRQEKTISP